MKKSKIFDDSYKLIISKKSLQLKIKEIAKKIYKDYKNKKQPPVLIFVLNGGMYFGVDLSRALQELGLEHVVDTIRTKRYSNDGKTEKIRLLNEPVVDLTDRDLIVIEDLVDQGDSIVFLNEYFSQKNINSINYAVMLIKKGHSPLSFKIKYKILILKEKGWVVGMGMDSHYQKRGIQDIYLKINDS